MRNSTRFEPSHITQLHRTRRAGACVLIASVCVSGCATLPNGSRWGENASFRVGWDRTAEAAVQAEKSPWVWAPLVTAAALQIDNADHHISDWAVDHTPVYGSVSGAHHASDDLEVAAGVVYLASVLAAPSGDSGSDWWSANLHGGLVGLGAIGATELTTEAIKVAANRQRPNGGDNSMPSGHTSFAAAADSMTARNLEDMPLSRAARITLTAGTDLLTFSTAWARVEAGAHFPSDVLVGMSIGNFFGRMFDNAFLGDDLAQRLTVSFEPEPHGGAIVWSLRF
jgi:membrane-associated phospholipid phosphatase